MKSIITVCSLITATLLFSSCSKKIDTPAPVFNPVTGSWFITDVSENNGYGWYSYDAGLNGIFSFYDDGAARYDDAGTFMQGNWYMNVVTTGYYNHYANYYSNAQQSADSGCQL